MSANHVSQAPAQVRFEWGLQGALTLGADADIAVVIDVLTFTTAVSVAVDAGSRILPYPWREGAEDHAARHGAGLAKRRSEAAVAEFSLSPGSLRKSQLPDKLVLPSPNGSTISAALADSDSLVAAGCLRNRDAIASCLAKRLLEQPKSVVLVIAAGEKWPDGSLRPSVEDLWGAGALLARLNTLTSATLSTEAQVAVSAFEAVDGHLQSALIESASGRELCQMGFEQDVLIAAEVDTSNTVPVLQDGAFVDLAR